MKKRVFVACIASVLLLAWAGIAQSAEAGRGSRSVRYERGRISIVADNVYRLDLLREIKKETSVDIRIHDGVEDKRVSIDVHGIPLFAIGDILEKLELRNHAVARLRHNGFMEVHVYPQGKNIQIQASSYTVIRSANFPDKQNYGTVKGREVVTVTDNHSVSSLRYVRNEALVKIPAGVSRGLLEETLSRRSLHPVWDNALSRIGYMKVRFDDGADFREVLESLKGEARIKGIEPNYILGTLAQTDPLLGDQWYVPESRFDGAWEYAKAGNTVKIAVVDSGVDLSHPDLKGKILPGYDFVNDDADPSDDHGHGTFVSGIIAAASNDLGIRGLFPFARIIPVKVVDGYGSATVEDVAKGILFSVDQGAQVINLSLGGYGYSDALQAAVDYAVAKGVTVIAAGGNDGIERAMYPAACEGVIGVSALDPGGAVWPGSNSGRHIGVSAPGANLVSTGMGGEYVYATGTSGAAAIVSALAAIARSEYPGWSANSVRNAIFRSVSDLGDKGWDKVYGAGKVDALAALKQEIPPFYDLGVSRVWLDRTNYVMGEPVTINARVSNFGTDPDGRFDAKCYTVTDNGVRTLVGETAGIFLESFVDLSFVFDNVTGAKNISFEVEIVSEGDGNPSNDKSSTARYSYSEKGDYYVLYLNDPAPVHQWIVWQAYKKLKYLYPDSSLVKELSTVIGVDNDYHPLLQYGFNVYSPDAYRRWDYSHDDVDVKNTSLLEGSWEEDQSEDYVYSRSWDHFWNPEEGYDSGWGTANPLVANYSAIRAGQRRFVSAISDYNYFGHNNDDISFARAYWWLGRTAHLLADMSVPSHTLIDVHLVGDSYEQFLGESKDAKGVYNYKNVGFNNSSAVPDYRTLPSYDRAPANSNSRLTKLFYSLANKSMRYDSDDSDGDDTKGKYNHWVASIDFPVGHGSISSVKEVNVITGSSVTLEKGVDYEYSSINYRLGIVINRIYFYGQYFDALWYKFGILKKIQIVFTDGSVYEPSIIHQIGELYPTNIQDAWELMPFVVPSSVLERIHQPVLESEAIDHVAALFQLFWEETHPDPLKITSDVKILGPRTLPGPYYVNEGLTARFTIRNDSFHPVVIDQLLIGGRYGTDTFAGTCPTTGICPDFIPNRSITIEAGQTYTYTGTFKPTKAGIYKFAPAYYSGGKWNTSGITPTVDIPVYDIPVPTTGTPYNNSGFVSGSTVSASFSPGQQLDMSWTLSNSGTTTWSTGYKLAFISQTGSGPGTLIQGVAAIPVSSPVLPAGSRTFSIRLNAPSNPGVYTGRWQMVDASGVAFGVPVWIALNVVSPAGSGGGEVAGRFAVGDWVAVGGTGVAGLRSRTCPDTNDATCPKICTVPDGGIGKLIDGPQSAASYAWYRVAWETGSGSCSTPGWSIQNYLSTIRNPAEGELIKSRTAAFVYLYKNGKKWWIRNEDIFNRMGYSWSAIREVPQEVINGIPAGPTLVGEGSLVKLSGDPKVYLLQGGSRRYITSEEAFVRSGYRWENIVEITASVLGLFPQGADVTLEPKVLLASPAGGERYLLDDPINILWTATDDAGIRSIDLYYSVDGGSAWSPIALSIPNSGIRPWVPPATAADCRIKVVATDSSGVATTAVSRSAFTVDVEYAYADFVVTAASVTPGSVATGDSFSIHADIRNAGTGKSAASNVKFYLSTSSTGTDTLVGEASIPQLDAGAVHPVTVTAALPATAASRAYIVTIANPDRIAAENDVTNNLSSSPISVADREPPLIRYVVLAGSLHKTGTEGQVLFGVSDNIGIDHLEFSYSLDNGATWSGITNRFVPGSNGLPNTFKWTIPTSIPPDSRLLLKMVAVDAAGNPADLTSGPYTIKDGTMPSVAILTPNGGEILSLGSTIDIRWSASSPNGVSVLRLSLCFNGRVEHIANITTDTTGSYRWTIPATGYYVTNDARIRLIVEDRNANVAEDFSDASFVIQDPSVPPPPPWTTPAILTAVPATNWPNVLKNDSSPVLATDNAGNVHMLYVYVQDNLSGMIAGTGPRIITQQVYYKKRIQSTWSEPSLVRELVQYTDGAMTGYKAIGDFQVVVGPDGKPHAAWVESMSGAIANMDQDDVFCVHYDGTSWSPPENVSGTVPDAGGRATKSESPRLASDLSGNVHLVWSDGSWYGSGVPKKLYHKVRSVGGGWSPISRLTDGYALYPAIAMDNSGNLHVAYLGESGGTNILNYIRHDGSAWTSPQLVSPDADGQINMALDRSGVPHIVWHSYDPVTYGTKILYSRAIGDLFSAPEQVSDLSVSTSSPQTPFVVVDNLDRPHLTFEEASRNRLVYRYRDSFGWSSPVQLNLDSQQVSMYSSKLVHGNDDTLHVAWSAGYNGAQEIHYNHATLGGGQADATPPVVTVSQPSSGSSLSIGSGSFILWRATDNQGVDNVSIDFSTDGVAYLPIAANLRNTGEYFWGVAGSPSDNATIRIIAIDEAGNRGFAYSGVFRITNTTPPIVEVAYPNGGESLSAGSPVPVRWTASGVNPVVRTDVFYSEDDGASWKGLGTTGTGNGFDWTAPRSASSACRIKVVAYDSVGNVGQDGSDGSFSIVTQNSPPFVPNSPTPENGAGNLSAAPLLSWAGGDPDLPDTVTYDVYAGVLDNLTLVSKGQSASGFSLAGLPPAATVRWRIVASDNNGASTSGPIWSFTTESVPVPVIGTDPGSIGFQSGPDNVVTPQSIEVWNAGRGILNWAVVSSDNWVTVTPSSGNGAGTITVNVLPGVLGIGEFSSSITISALGAANSPVTIPVTLKKSSGLSVLNISMNGAGKGRVEIAPASVGMSSEGQMLFETGTLVSLTPVPDGNSVFAGWSGACTGMETCAITAGNGGEASARFSVVPAVTPIAIPVTGQVRKNGRPVEAGDELVAMCVHGKPGSMTAYEKRHVGRGVVESVGQMPSLSVYGDDLSTEGAIEGCLQGEEIQFSLWSSTEQQEYFAYLDNATGLAAKLLFDPAISEIPANLDFVEGQRIPLRTNAWNLVSFGVLKGYRSAGWPSPSSPQLSRAFYEEVADLGDAMPLKSIAGQYDRVIGNAGNGTSFWNPALPSFSTLNSFQPGYGYWIKMKPSAQRLAWMTVTGPRTKGTETLQASPGWTLLGYWGHRIQHDALFDPSSGLYPIDAGDNVLVSTIGDLWSRFGGRYSRVNSFDSSGVKIWNPALPGFSTLHAMGPGYGYWVKMSGESELAYAVAPPVFSVPPGTSNSGQVVSITSSTPNASIRYTLDGSMPSSVRGILYSEPIAIDPNTMVTIKAIAYRSGWEDSPISEGRWTVTGVVDAPIFSPPPGLSVNPVNITISTSSSGATIRYTLDGSTPTSSHGILYTAPIEAGPESNVTVKAVAFQAGWSDSPVSSGTFTTTGIVAAPTFTPTPGTYSTTQLISISTGTPGAVIRYTTDGSTPTPLSGLSYTAPIAIDPGARLTIKAVASKADWADSSVSSATFTIVSNVTTPSFSPTPGTRSRAQFVTLSTTTPGAVIRFTTDNTTPTATAGIVYSGPFVVNETTTIRAVACLTDGSVSPMATGIYSLGEASSLRFRAGASIYHSIVVGSGGTAWAWGGNDFGQLGDGTMTQSLGAIRVSGLVGAVSVAAGAFHSVALDSSGDVWCWGGNSSGLLGDGTTTFHALPAKVPTLTGIAAIASGGSHTVVLKKDGTVWTWGNNQSGQLGDGTTNNSMIPVPVVGLGNVVAIAAKGSNTAALKSDGTVWTWGSNNVGQLGDGSKVNRSVPVPVTGLTGVVAVSVGGGHMVALNDNGAVLTWGGNGDGQLGDGTTIDRLAPVPVPGLSDAIDVAAGSSHTLVLMQDGTVRAWGRNVSGQLGDGTTLNRATPVPVMNLSGVVALAGGLGQSIAVRTDGSVRAWGVNSSGQLGDGTTTNSPLPLQVSGVAAKPPAPYGLIWGSDLAGGAISLKLVWINPGMDNAASCRIYRDGNLLGTSTSGSYFDLSTIAQQTYQYEVSSIDNTGRESDRVSVSCMTPVFYYSGPEEYSLSANNTTSGYVDLLLDGMSANNYDVNYGVYRNGIYFGTYNGATTSHVMTDTTVEASNTYMYSLFRGTFVQMLPHDPNSWDVHPSMPTDYIKVVVPVGGTP